jgi:hypothetical protein
MAWPCGEVGTREVVIGSEIYKAYENVDVSKWQRCEAWHSGVSYRDQQQIE